MSLGEDRRKALAQAIVQLIGSILQLDVAANVINVVLAIPGGSRRQLENQIKGQITQLLRHEYAGLRPADREAVVTALDDTMRAISVNDDLARLARDPHALARELISRSPSRHVMQDPVTGECFANMTHVCAAFVAGALKRESRFLPVRLEQVEREVLTLTESTAAQDRQIRRLGEVVAAESTKPSLLLSPDPIHHPVPLLDWRPLPETFVGREPELNAVSAGVAGNGLFGVSGWAMTGRYEVLREWCRRHRDVSQAWVLDFTEASAAQLRLDALAARFHVPSGSDAAVVIARVCDAAPDITLVAVGVHSESLFKRLQDVCRAGQGVCLLVLGDQPRDCTDVLALEPLKADHIEAILHEQLVGLGTPQENVRALAERLVGEPLIARQAVAFIGSTGCCVAEYLEMLSETPHVLLTSSATRDASDRTASTVWEHSLRGVREATGQDGGACLALLHLMGDRVIEGAWHGAVAFWLTGADELGAKAQTLLLSKALSDMKLVRVGNGIVEVPPLLSAYCWSRASAVTRQQAVAACLRIAKLSAGAGQVSLHAATVNGSSWLLTADLGKFRAVDAAFLDETLLQAGALLAAADLPEWAHYLYWRGLVLQDSAGDTVAAFRAGVQMCKLLLWQKWPGWYELFELLSENFAADPEVHADYALDYELLAAQVDWERGRLESGERHAQLSLRLTAASPVDDTTLMRRVGALRVLGWLRIASGRVERGLRSLMEGLELLQSDERFAWMAEEHRADTVSFLMRQGVTVPERLRHGSSVQERRRGTLDSLVSLAASNAAAAQGDFDTAAQLLGTGPEVAFDDLFNAYTEARLKQQRARLLLDEFAVNAQSGQKGRETLGQAAELLDGALATLAALPDSLASSFRIQVLQNAIKFNKAIIHLARDDDPDGAIRLTREALESDEELFGTDHAEYALDASQLGALLLRERPGEARRWLHVARDIHARPGPHRDVREVARIDELLRLSRLS